MEKVSFIVGFVITFFLIMLYAHTRLTSFIVNRLIEDRKLPNDLSVVSIAKFKLQKTKLISNQSYFKSLAFIFHVEFEGTEYSLSSTLAGKVTYL